MDSRYVLINRSTLDDVKTMIQRAIRYCDRAEPMDYSQPYYGLIDDDAATTTYPGATGYSSGTMKSVLHILNMQTSISDLQSLKMLVEAEEEQRQASPLVSGISAASA